MQTVYSLFIKTINNENRNVMREEGSVVEEIGYKRLIRFNGLRRIEVDTVPPKSSNKMKAR